MGFLGDDVCFERPEHDRDSPTSLSDFAEARYIGWTISGAAAAVSTLIALFLILKHAQYYTKPNQQRYIIRIILMVPIYAIISWLSYYFYTEAVYYQLIRNCYEAFVIASFFALLLQYLGDTIEEQRRVVRLHWKPIAVPFPFCCIMCNPSDPHFLQILKYGILQYVILQPLCTIASVISHYKGVYCPESYSFSHAHVYIMIIIFVSVTISLYSLIILYQAVKVDLAPYKPFSKFLCVKAIIFFMFWQEILIGGLATGGIIQPTPYWTAANITTGLSSILTCFEMIIFALLHTKAFDYRPYRPEGRHRQTIWRALLDSLNPWDFVVEIAYGVLYLRYMCGGRPPKDLREAEQGTFDLEVAMDKARPGSELLTRALSRRRSGRIPRRAVSTSSSTSASTYQSRRARMHGKGRGSEVREEDRRASTPGRWTSDLGDVEMTYPSTTTHPSTHHSPSHPSSWTSKAPPSGSFIHGPRVTTRAPMGAGVGEGSSSGPRLNGRGGEEIALADSYIYEEPTEEGSSIPSRAFSSSISRPIQDQSRLGTWQVEGAESSLSTTFSSSLSVQRSDPSIIIGSSQEEEEGRGREGGRRVEGYTHAMRHNLPSRDLPDRRGKGDDMVTVLSQETESTDGDTDLSSEVGRSPPRFSQASYYVVRRGHWVPEPAQPSIRRSRTDESVRQSRHDHPRDMEEGWDGHRGVGGSGPGQVSDDSLGRSSGLTHRTMSMGDLTPEEQEMILEGRRRSSHFYPPYPSQIPPFSGSREMRGSRQSTISRNSSEGERMSNLRGSWGRQRSEDWVGGRAPGRTSRFGIGLGEEEGMGQSGDGNGGQGREHQRRRGSRRHRRSYTASAVPPSLSTGGGGRGDRERSGRESNYPSLERSISPGLVRELTDRWERRSSISSAPSSDAYGHSVQEVLGGREEREGGKIGRVSEGRPRLHRVYSSQNMLPPEEEEEEEEGGEGTMLDLDPDEGLHPVWDGVHQGSVYGETMAEPIAEPMVAAIVDARTGHSSSGLVDMMDDERRPTSARVIQPAPDLPLGYEAEVEEVIVDESPAASEERLYWQPPTSWDSRDGDEEREVEGEETMIYLGTRDDLPLDRVREPSQGMGREDLLQDLMRDPMILTAHSDSDQEGAESASTSGAATQRTTGSSGLSRYEAMELRDSGPGEDENTSQEDHVSPRLRRDEEWGRPRRQGEEEEREGGGLGQIRSRAPLFPNSRGAPSSSSSSVSSLPRQ